MNFFKNIIYILLIICSLYCKNFPDSAKIENEIVENDISLRGSWESEYYQGDLGEVEKIIITFNNKTYIETEYSYEDVNEDTIPDDDAYMAIIKTGTYETIIDESNLNQITQRLCTESTKVVLRTKSPHSISTQ